MKAQALMGALTDELARLRQELADLDAWEAQVNKGKWAELMLSNGMTKRDARQWIGGARDNATKTEERLRKLYDRFSASQ